MGDTTGGFMEVRNLPRVTLVDTQHTLVDQVRDLFDSYVINRTGGDEGEDDTNVYRAGEVSCGAADVIASDLTGLMKEAGVRFSFYVYEDPRYEWLGNGVLYVDGDPPLEWRGDVDAEGEPIVGVKALTTAIDTARSLQELRDQADGFIGRAAFAAWEAIEPKPPAASPAKGITLTTGEAIEHFRRFPSDTPITVGTPDGGGWFNIDGLTNPKATDEHSIILITRDDFDTRQW